MEILRSIQAVVGQNGNQPGHHSKLSDFQRTKPPSFSQAIDPLDADDWLRTMERKLEVARTDEGDKVPFVTHYLEGAAAIWWENEKAIGTADEEITRSRFKERFRRYHIPTGIMKAKQRDFLALLQGSQSVREYLLKFNHLSRYSPYDVATEERKIDRFLGGLNPQLRCTLSMLDFPDFQTVVNKAFIAEREHKLVSDTKPVNNDHKRKFKPRKEMQPVQKARTWQPTQLMESGLLSVKVFGNSRIRLGCCVESSTDDEISSSSDSGEEDSASDDDSGGREDDDSKSG
nr:uncharacterized protein LOC109754934 [Aegilops tauschii subsp. strangulata]